MRRGLSDFGRLALRVCPIVLGACSGAPFEAPTDAGPPVEASPLPLGAPETAPSSGGVPSSGGARGASSGGLASSGGARGVAGAPLASGGASSLEAGAGGAAGEPSSGGAAPSSGGAGPLPDCSPAVNPAAFAGVCGPGVRVLYPCTAAPAGCVMHAGIVCCP